MIIIRIYKKELIVTTLLILVVLIGLGLYSCIQNVTSIKTNRLMEIDPRLLGNYDVTAYLVSVNKEENVEVFDIEKGKVTKEVPINDKIKSEAVKYLESITGVYVKVKAFPEEGYIVKIPFEPPFEVKNQWLNDYGINFLDKVFILFPRKGAPYLLVLDSKERPHFYNFEGDTGKLASELKL